MSALTKPGPPRRRRARLGHTALRLLAAGAIVLAVGVAPAAATSAAGAAHRDGRASAPRPPGQSDAASRPSPPSPPSPSSPSSASSASSRTSAEADAGYTDANLPDWAIGPFTRSAANPLLSPSGSGYEAAALYNPGVLYRGGQYKMLYRAQGSYGGPSQIGYASSTDGTHFAEDTAANPVIGFDLAGQQDKCGLEDPRLFELHGTYYSFFTSVHPKADGSCLGSYDISEATSTDGVHWSTPWTVEPGAGNNKDAAVVTDADGTPRKINGEYVMYFGQGDTGTDIAYSSDMRTWHAKGSTTARTADPLDVHYPKGWQPYEVSVAVTDYRTVAGRPANSDIVVFTAGTLMANGRWFYAISEEEFSGRQPTLMLHQLSDAVLTPTPDVPYEWNGQTPKTVWMNSILFHDGKWMMYYGGGDTVTGLATAGLRRPLPARSGQTPFQTGFEHGQPMPDWVDGVDTAPGGGGIANVTRYGSATSPESSTRQENNHDGANALMYSGQAAGAPDDHAYMRLFDLSDRPVSVGRDTTLSYWIHPQAQGTAAPGVSGDNSGCVSLDLVFADGGTLHGLRGSPLTPASQCGTLRLDQWNQVSVDLGKAAAGRKIVRIDLGYDRPASSGGYRGYVDDIALTNAPSRPATISGITPAQAAPGQRVTITGTGFGPSSRGRHLLLSDAGVHWGGAGDLGTLRIDHWSDTSVTFTVPEPSGPAVSTPSGPANVWRVEPGSVASVAVVTGAAGTSGTTQFTVAATDALSDYYNDVGISPDTDRGCGALDNGTDTYSADALATASPYPLTPGAHLTVGGLAFTWPDARPCENDNLRALGQTILTPHKVGAGEIGFLGAATNGDHSGTVTIHYTDGSSGTATLRQSDWGSTPGAGNTEVAAVPYRNQALGRQVHAFYVDEQTIPVDADRIVASITLPTNKDIHVFAIAQDGSAV
ncbi:glycoside hydrolase family 130 protein [Actinacidiphila yeochonensis]|uniref:glycoside hydrolase family 130 protein n=1 Tax=Actinacidiphila yeochonensis TaxID=89050 RepID=UPI000566A41B|nr:IPT/TIG domain-containing protein [Actinacidiphila yeochonensis]